MGARMRSPTRPMNLSSPIRRFTDRSAGGREGKTAWRPSRSKSFQDSGSRTDPEEGEAVTATRKIKRSRCTHFVHLIDQMPATTGRADIAPNAISQEEGSEQQIDETHLRPLLAAALSRRPIMARTSRSVFQGRNRAGVS